jgi:hypothetical protein
LLALELADYFRTYGLDEEQKLDPANWLPLLEPVESAAGKTGSLAWEAGPSAQELVPGGLGSALWEMRELEAPEQGVRFRYTPPGGR